MKKIFLALSFCLSIFTIQLAHADDECTAFENQILGEWKAGQFSSIYSNVDLVIVDSSGPGLIARDFTFQTKSGSDGIHGIYGECKHENGKLKEVFNGKGSTLTVELQSPTSLLLEGTVTGYQYNPFKGTLNLSQSAKRN